VRLKTRVNNNLKSLFKKHLRNCSNVTDFSARMSFRTAVFWQKRTQNNVPIPLLGQASVRAKSGIRFYGAIEMPKNAY
jgi:hypothetical protein